MKIIPPLPHAVLDYLAAALVLFAPALFGFSSTAAWTLAQASGIAYFGVSLLTRYRLGALKLIPFPTHGVIESALGAAWIISPWLLGFSADAAARNFFVVAGIALLGVVALTDYRATERSTPSYSGQERRHGIADRRMRMIPVAQERRATIRRRGGWAGA